MAAGFNRRAAGWLGYGLAVAFAVVALQWLAWDAWRAHLVGQSARTIATLERGDTPYRWMPRGEHDLVAGRLFGTNAYEFDERGLRVEGNGEAFQIGLPYSGAIDLALYDRLELDAADIAGSQATLVVRETLGGPMRFALVPAGEASIELAGLAWADEFGIAVSTPRRFAMLRVQAQPPKGEAFRFTAARVLSSRGKVDYAPWTPVKPGAINIAEPAPGVVPRYRLDTHQTLEAAMAQRDRLLQHAPTALFVLGSDTRDVDETARALAAHDVAAATGSLSDARWPALALYAASLLLLRLRPPRHARLRAALEAAGALAAPFGLVIGGFVGDNPDAWITLVAAVSLAFALSLKPVDTLRPWRWLGVPAAWIAPLATVVLAVMLAAWGHRGDSGLHWPDRITLLRYLAWVVLQQYLICVVLADRLQRTGLAPRWIAFAAALVFALLHTPNAMLMLATFAGGLVWSAAWVRDRALLPIVAAHVASATILLAGLPPEILRSAEVSARFFL
jgi:hypothetical protein